MVLVDSVLVVLGGAIHKIVFKELLILFGSEYGLDFGKIFRAHGLSVLAGGGVTLAGRFFEVFYCLFLGVVEVESGKGIFTFGFGFLAFADRLAFGFGSACWGGGGVLGRSVDGQESNDGGCNANNFLFHILIGFVLFCDYCLFGYMTSQAQIGLIRACGFNFYF